MKNLLIAFQQMHREKWDYYYFGNSLVNPFNEISETNFNEFIEMYFSSSGKRLLINEFKTYVKFSPERAIHTVTIFFLGILIWEKTKLNSLIFEDENNVRGNPTFQFVWFLSILFHDYAESIEEKLDYNDLDDLFQKYKINHKLTDLEKVNHIDNKLFRLVKKYFSYRRYSMKSIDHGILAGIYMYDGLIKIRRKKQAEGKLENDNGLHWHESLENHYATAAGAVVCHNIWTTKKHSADHSDYIKFELGALVRPTFKKIKCDNNPLLFLFGLVDTIDPIKYFMKKGITPEKILNNLDIECSDDSITIINNDFKEEIFKQYRDDNARNFEGWLDLSVEMVSGKSFIIKLNK